ncbi:MAG: TIGR03087 family PEP-CTERM/XrtA system glycosyltransferase [Betaproteobacteria bacterium]|nr:TIGR03087 family PEP-CTERM/XrtA system glycosyltransferase [Betaproteobacteria bacterium]
MDELLFLSHRIPYPPNKGDKIRSYHLLKFLAQRFRVHLGTFVDDPDDWQHVPTVKALCAETCFVPLGKRAATFRSLRGLLTGRPLTLPYYENRTLRAWVDRLLAERNVRHAMVFSSSMAQYLDGTSLDCRIADLVDVDSDKWAQYAAKMRGPRKWVYARESRLLAAYESGVAQQFDATYLVSAAEADLLRRIAPAASRRIGYFNNGVDSAYFSPEHEHDDPFAAGERAVVFTGAMDYWPNVDAVTWFADEVLPEVRRSIPSATFYIVGARPSQAVSELGRREGVRVTGTVPDVRPFLAHAGVVVAPLRVARGIQNKVLEAMAMGRTVVVSPAAMEGIEAERGRELVEAASAAAFARAVIEHLRSPVAAIGRLARERVITSYSWEANLAPIEVDLHRRPGGHEGKDGAVIREVPLRAVGSAS